MIDGILLINKEKGITSYDVIRKLKKILPKNQKIGHSGTLDPFATGLLVILLGKSTKLMEKILSFEKEYLVTAEFGFSTDTQDITGKKINTSSVEEKISQETLLSALEKNFLGDISQTPPIYSAKKVKGKKAYEYARENIIVELKPKDVTIQKFCIIEYSWPIVQFDVICSSGTYIRTLVNDLGEKVGSFATAIDLKRIKVGEFDLSDAIKSEDIVQGVKLNLIELNNE